jgi:NADPH-dependent glutamate synthase beta subunit-like oxidoreductase
MDTSDCLKNKCFDPEAIIPISRQSTEHFKTGSWSKRKPIFAEKSSPCRAACPNGNDIPRAFWSVSEDDFDGALAAFLQESPLPGVCGRVCYHPCQSRCNWATAGAPVNIREIERAAAERGTAAIEMLSSSGVGKPVAVIGSGPAGLAAAYHLARMGHPITLVEARESLGGLLHSGIPSYRLPPSTLAADVERILTLPITVRTGTHVTDRFLDELLADHLAAFLALGAGTSVGTGIPGEDLGNVVAGLDFLRRPDLQEKSRNSRVVVVGGGNTAVDAARTALRRGAAEVTILYRRNRALMPAFEDDIVEAEEEGIKFCFLKGPVEFMGRDNRLERIRVVECEPSSENRNARPVPVSGTETELLCDLAILAVGQGVAPESPISGLQWADGRIWIDSCGRTSRPSVFAGGDFTPAKASVVDAMASGKLAALAIHRSLTSSDSERFTEGVLLGGGVSFSVHSYFNPSETWKPGEVAIMEGMDVFPEQMKPLLEINRRNPIERRSDFSEVNPAADIESIQAEAQRCFACGICVRCGLCGIYCPEAAIVSPSSTFDESEMETKKEYCKGCGVCAAECPRGVISMGDSL